MSRLVRLYPVVVLIVAATANGAEWALRTSIGGDGLVRFEDDTRATLAGPEAIVRWQGSVPRTLKADADTVTLALTSSGLIATAVRGQRGRFGETVFSIDVHNRGPETATGALLPPLSTWRDTKQALSTHSAEFMLLTSGRVEIGTLGVHRSWSPGAEFDADTFVTSPDSQKRGHISAVLLLVSNETVHAREEVTLKPGEDCRYELHVEAGDGPRNAALREIYRLRGGYRVVPSLYHFDAYNAPETSWAKNLTAVWMNWAWDQANMDPRTGAWRLLDSVEAARKRFGGFDAFVFWPFWPRAGYDDRYQFDHYADLPGGLAGLRDQIERLHEQALHVFVSYCHWSESDRGKSPEAMARSYADFANLACRVNADGAVMDLMSKTPEDILGRAKQCGRTLVPYNEGDPTWSDTQTNLIGRIHNDLPMPEFNLKRYLLPHHPQLRVCETGNSGRRMRNDFVLSFFNGHGVEINTMFPDDNPANEADWPILARALDLLRTHRANFASADWQPLVDCDDPAVWVNEWPAADKTVYTVCGTSPGGHHGALLSVAHDLHTHYVDLWRYRALSARQEGKTDVIDYDVDGYTPGLGSVRGTGDYSPGSIGAFRRRLRSELDFEMLRVSTEQPKEGERIEIWLGTVRPDVKPVTVSTDAEVDLYQQFGRHSNEAVILRLMNSAGQVEDVDVLAGESVRFFRIDKPKATDLVVRGQQPAGMIRIPGRPYVYRLTNPSPPSDYPYASPPFQATYAYMAGVASISRTVQLKPFWIDRYPVTNREYASFLAGTGYRPQNDNNFLKHFLNGHVAPGLENHPVVYVSYDDAKAYAQWAGKRLPTEEEWQFAAGAEDGRQWPWGNEAPISNRDIRSTGTQPVDAHPSQASPYGVEDMVGNIWQWTASLMDNGRELTVMLRGGSWYYPPKGRWWVPGGVRRITENYPLPLAGPGMNRLATVGFRCVKDE